TAALVFLRWSERRYAGWRYPIAVFALFLGALSSKTVTSTLPIGLAIALWLKHGRIDKRAIALLTPMLVAGAAFAAITRHLEKTQIGTTGADWALTFAERAALSGRIVWFYLSKLAWPSNLTFIY